jgi:hypothetical protein
VTTTTNTTTTLPGETDHDLAAFIWRDTLDDGYIGVRNFSHGVKEKTQAQLKDWKTDFDKVVTNNISTFIDHSNGQ